MNYQDPDREKQLDAALDAALAHYNRDAEPRVGLEDRILANLRTQPLAQKPRWLSWRWMTAAAITAIVLIAILLTPRTQPKPSPNPITAAANNAKTSTVQNAPKIVASKVTPMKRRSAKSKPAKETITPSPQLAAVPHQPVFPAPAPLSQQERMLLSYVRRTPETVLIAVSEEQQLHEQQWMQEMEQLQKSQQKSEHLK